MKRIEKIRQLLEEKHVDALVIKSKANKIYLQALTGSGVKVLITKDRLIQIMDGRYVNEANMKTKQFESVVISQGEDYFDAVKKIVGEGLVAFESSQLLASEYLKMNEKGLKIHLLDNELEVIRKNKDELELEYIRKACEVTDNIFAEVVQSIRVGMSENDISALIQYLAIQQGASGMAFDTIVASGERGCLPHGRPTDRKIMEHDFITIDFGIILDGYQSDMTRTICVGTPKPELKKIYDIVLEAQCAGVDYIKAGVTGKEVDQHVRKIIEDYGYGEYFTHGLGHGMGIGEGELPVLNQRSQTILEEGMVMSCEPGIYIPGLGGVRIEDDVCIVNGRGIALNKTTKQLIQCEVKDEE